MESPDTFTENPKLNNILASLNKADYDRILPDLKLVEMPLGWTIAEAGDHIKYIYFPISGVVSLIYDLENGSLDFTRFNRHIIMSKLERRIKNEGYQVYSRI